VKGLWSPDTETRRTARRRRSVDLHVGHARPGRSAPHASIEPLDGLGIALDFDLDATVRQIAYPSVEPFASRRSFGEKAETDALNAAADEIPSRDTHT
jgi:hypothetical protein